MDLGEANKTRGNVIPMLFTRLIAFTPNSTWSCEFSRPSVLRVNKWLLLAFRSKPHLLVKLGTNCIAAEALFARCSPLP